MPNEESSYNHALNYSKDILGDSFEKLNITLKPDYEGEVLATLIRKKAQKVSSQAVLYIHGFNDYFFQKELANNFNDNGYNFYALDLRKYGRSWMEHQKFNNVRSLREYDEEITKALEIIKLEANQKVILMGHSTGGLIVTNYAGNHLQNTLFHGIICNSPFYDFNLNLIERKLGMPFLSFLGRFFPNKLISSGFTKLYGYSLHFKKYGEWDYSLKWKPHDIPRVNLGFINAIYKAQQNIHKGLHLSVPILVLHSDTSIYSKKWTDRLLKGDAVLNVDHIQKYASKLKGDVSIITINNGMHDLILSRKPVRAKVYKNIFEWVKEKFN